jgi:hypothetical protein
MVAVAAAVFVAAPPAEAQPANSVTPQRYARPSPAERSTQATQATQATRAIGGRDSSPAVTGTFGGGAAGNTDAAVNSSGSPGIGADRPRGTPLIRLRSGAGEIENAQEKPPQLDINHLP